MTYKDAYELEKRDCNNLFKIYLVKDGEWMRAYEWSCYLLKLLPSKKQEDGISLNYMRKNWSYLPNEGLLVVGVKEMFLSPFLPTDVEITKETINEHEVFVIDASKYLAETDISVETYSKVLLEQKETVELPKQKSFNKNESNIRCADNNISTSDILKELIEFPIMSKSPLECYEFIRNIQSKIICKYINK